MLIYERKHEEAVWLGNTGTITPSSLVYNTRIWPVVRQTGKMASQRKKPHSLSLYADKYFEKAYASEIREESALADRKEIPENSVELLEIIALEPGRKVVPRAADLSETVSLALRSDAQLAKSNPNYKSISPVLMLMHGNYLYFLQYQDIEPRSEAELALKFLMKCGKRDDIHHDWEAEYESTVESMPARYTVAKKLEETGLFKTVAFSMDARDLETASTIGKRHTQKMDQLRIIRLK